MLSNPLIPVALAALALAAASVQAQDARPAGATTNTTATEQVIVPQVERRQVKRPRYASSDFGVGLYVGTYATENFGSSRVAGLRLAYHITEDYFVDVTYGRSRISDENFRQVLPGGIFVNRNEALSYLGLSAGWNLLPGEVFLGRFGARATQGYLIGGIGSTNFAGLKRQSFHLGFGLRLMVNDHFAVQADVRDHFYTLDLLGRNQRTQNPELTLGLTVFF
ncbi:conserved exported hypothetical protein [Rubrivivax sp. A210]|uniref:outer membrane beta-barrel domain-containing protein n=1 Tax=Rubrivivax sp. A210 TaxID=2772301 RepID=UPI001917A7A5|nr:outer membrane beta-barrel domain-containing protein [Rubrivivax sp. A210]CAD5374969.1 conserved exported hypothetical protein [Rubrivivax sp. A210]